MQYDTMTPSDEYKVESYRWGRDHFTTLLYIETRCVDYKGIIAKEKMRCDPRRHPALAHIGSKGVYPTIINNGDFDTEWPNHDDWDCLRDMARYGLVVVDTITLHASLTEKGWFVAGRLRQYRAANGGVAKFPIDDTMTLYEEQRRYMPNDPILRVGRALEYATKALSEVEQLRAKWETSTRLVSGGGDPDGVTPAQNAAHIDTLVRVAEAAKSVQRYDDEALDHYKFGRGDAQRALREALAALPKDEGTV